MNQDGQFGLFPAMNRAQARTAVRVAAVVVRNPLTVPTLSCMLHSKTTWEMGRPWWNAAAVAYLAARVRPNDRAWEWGSGGSTVWLKEHGAKVTSIEHDREWADKVRDRCPGADVRLVPGTDRGRLRSEADFSDRGVHFFDDYVIAITTVADESLDVVIVDGICRIECVRRAAPKLKSGGLLALDDTDFPLVGPKLANVQEVRGWHVVRKAGFKRHPLVLTETTFLHKT